MKNWIAKHEQDVTRSFAAGQRGAFALLGGTELSGRRFMLAVFVLVLLIGSPARGQSPQPEGIITTVAGGYLGDGMPALSASLSSPTRLFVDATGNLYISDTADHRIRKVSASGIVSTFAGNGLRGYSGDGGPAVNASINYPQGISGDASGNIYFAEFYSHRVRRVDPSGIITTVAGTGIGGFSGDGGPAMNARLQYPQGVAVDASGNLYIAEQSNYRIRKVNTSGIISTVAGNGTSNFVADGVPATSTGMLYATDVAVDAAGNFYYNDLYNNRIRKVNAAGIVTTLAGNGTPGYSGDGGPATSAALYRPYGSLVTDPAGNVYFADNNRIRKVDTSGIITTVAGSGVAGFSGDGGPALSASIAPTGVCLDASGRLYIAGSRRIRRIDLSGTIATVAGGHFADGVPAVATSLASPAGIYIGRSGAVYIADSGNDRIRKVEVSGVITTVAGNGTRGYSGDEGSALSASLYGPRWVCENEAGILYIADGGNRRIRRVDLSGIITTVAGNGVQGDSGDGGPATDASLGNPACISLDISGSLYIADQTNHRIRKVDPSGIITTVAGNGTQGYGGDGGLATGAALSNPNGVWADGKGNLFIADTGNYRIRKVLPSGAITTVAGVGLAGYEGDGDLAIRARLSPNAIIGDSTGQIYVTDNNANRIRRVNPGGVITSVAGNNVTGGYSGDGGPAISALLYSPNSPALDAAGDLYFSDSGNSRIRKISYPHYHASASRLSFGATSLGTTRAQTFYVSNTGAAPLTVTAMNLSGPDATLFSVNPTSFTIQPGAAAQSVSVAFAPTTAGGKSAALTIAHTGTEMPGVISLTGNGSQLVPVTMAFPGGLIGAQGDTVTVPILVSTSARIGTAQFVVNYHDQALAFVSAEPGPEASGLVVTNVNTTLPFPPSDPTTNRNVLVQVGGGATQSFTGDGKAVAILKFRVVGGAPNRWSLSFDRGADRTNVTTVAPATLGGEAITFQDSGILIRALSGRILVPRNASGAIGDSVRVPIRVEMLDPALRIAIAQFTIEYNPGSLAFHRAQAGPDAPGFTVVNTNANLPFSPTTPGLGKNVLVQISGGGANTFGPGHVATLVFTAISIQPSPLAVDLTADHTSLTSPSLRTYRGSDLSSGIIGPQASIPPSLDFGDVQVGTYRPMALMITNTGGDTLKAYPSELAGANASEFRFSPATVVILPGRSAGIGIDFEPTSAGAKTASLTVGHTAPGGSVTVLLTGNATSPPPPPAPPPPPPPPTVDYTTTATSGVGQVVVDFRLSVQPATPLRSVSWTFGDGETSTVVHPTHTFRTPGIFTVRVDVTTEIGQVISRVKENLITVTHPPPEVDYSATPTSGRAPLTVRFTSTRSGGPVTSYEWSFGDGSILSSMQDTVTHRYDGAGTYSVVLKVSGPGGSDTETKTGYITVSPGLVARFGANPVSGKAPLAVSFSDSSLGSPVSWAWDFGDGATSGERNPSHTFSPGIYTVILTVTGPGGQADTQTRAQFVRVSPVADFIAAPVTGIDSLVVQFTDTSTGQVTSRLWDFGDGTTSAQPNPVHLYRGVGVYTPKLTITGPSGTDTRERRDLITIGQGVVANFTAEPVAGRAPLTVKFLDASVGNPTSWSWEFGDGATSSERNPTHTFTRADSFSVTLRIVGAAGSGSKTIPKMIAVLANRPPSPPEARYPVDNGDRIPLTPKLTWKPSTDPDGDPLAYDVFLGSDRVGSTSDTSLVIGPLLEATEYTWHLSAHDDRGGTAEGPTRRFRTVGDTLAPVVLQGPLLENVTQTAATLVWTTDEPSIPAAEYRLRGGAPDFISSAQGPLGKSHRLVLSGLLPGTTYEYRVRVRDVMGNERSFPFAPYPAFTTLSAADTTAPQFVVMPSILYVADTVAVVVWTTDERSSSQAAYRPESETGYLDAPPGEMGKEHRVVIAGLRPGVAYMIRVRSEDLSGNTAEGPDLRVVTPSRVSPVVRPKISSLGLVGRTESQAVIEWSTDRPASSMIQYGLSSTLRISLTETGDDGVMGHQVTLTRLSAGTEYFYRAISAGAGGADTSDVLTFKTRATVRTVPPVILEGPLVQGIGETRATVQWKTDEVSSSAVEFDTTSTIASREVSRPDPVADHAITLTGLTPATTYYFRAISTGLTRLTAASAVLSFRTLASRDTVPPTILEGPTVTVRTSSGFTAEWKTDEISTTEMSCGQPDSTAESLSVPGLVGRHVVAVTGLKPATTYAFRVRSADAAGNLLESALSQVTTLVDSLVDRTSPRLVSPPSVAGATDRTATVTWETDEPSNGIVEFGKRADDLSEIQGDPRVFEVRHTIQLANLDAGTLYHYRIFSTDPSGNGPTRSLGDLTFTTRVAPDTIPASITSGPTVVSVTDRGATLEWKTDKLSDTQLEYGLGSDLSPSQLTGQLTLPEPTTVHRVTLSNLTPDTLYTFRAGSRDLARNARTFSPTRIFRTEAGADSIPPDMVGMPASMEQTASTSTITWTTDEPTNLALEYGPGHYALGRIERGELTRDHTVTLTGLMPGTEYRYRITGRDREGNGVMTDPLLTLPPPRTRLRSADLRFRTTSVADVTPPVIVEGPLVQISGNNVVVRWVTDELSNSRLIYATPANYSRPGLEQELFDATPVTVHLLSVAGLDLNTQYLYRCISSDAAGNTVTSGSPRSTKPAGGGLALQPPGGDGSFVTAPTADRQPPVILSGPTLVGATSNTLALEWQTDEASDSFVEHGPGDRYSGRTEDGTPATRHRIVLAKLSPGTRYQFVVGSTDPSRNGPTRSKPAVAATSAEVDATPPKILGDAAISYKSDRQAILTWKTDEPSSSTVRYGTGADLSLVRAVPDPVTEHRVVLTNLSPGTSYSIQAGSADLSNNGPTLTPVLSFTTDAAPDVTPPKIAEAPKISSISNQAATVTWQTDEVSDSGVRYGTTASALDLNQGSSEAVTAHKVVLTNLKPATTYFLRVSSVDRVGNGPAVSPPLGQSVSFTTSAGRDTTAPLQVRMLIGQPGSGSVALNWRAGTEPDLAGYNLYRAMESEELKLIATNLTVTKFRDTGLLDEKTYRYTVTALDGSGNEGPMSEAVTAVPSGRWTPSAPVFRAIQGRPLMPTFIVGNASSPRGAQLTYSFQVSARPDFTDLVASVAGLKEGNESGETGLTAWTISRQLADRATYYLRVRANDGAFDGPFSAVQPFVVDAGAWDRRSDFDENYIVDFEDFFQFALTFGKTKGEEGYQATCDLDRCGVIDFDDFFLFAEDFGKRYYRLGLPGSKPAMAFSSQPDPSLRPSFRAVGPFPAVGEDVTASVSLSETVAIKGYGIRIGYDPDRLEYLGIESRQAELFRVIPGEPGELAVMAFERQGMEMTAATNRDGSASSAMSLVKPRFRVKGISTEPAAWLSELIVLDAEDRRRIPDHAGTQKLSLVPKEAMLLHNYPNPFNPFTTIRYGIPEDARVTIAIYNILGQRLTVLLDCPQVAGYHVVTWDGRDPQGRKMASGIYLYQMKTGRLSLVEKMVLVK